MRKLIVSMNITLDGFLSGPHCELDWHFESWTSDMAEALGAELANADMLLLGRTTYTAMAAHWASMAQRMDCSREDIAFLEMMSRIDKVVVAGKGVSGGWGHTTVLSGPFENDVIKLKNTGGKNILVYGSAMLVAALQASGLVDEYHLWLHPVAIREGKPLFKGLQKMRLSRHDVFESGVMRLVYNMVGIFDSHATGEANAS